MDGLRRMDETPARLKAGAGRMAVCASNSTVRKIRDAVELRADIPIFPTETEALRHLSAP